MQNLLVCCNCFVHQGLNEQNLKAAEDDSNGRVQDVKSIGASTAVEGLGEDADSAGEDEEDEASKEGEAQQAFVDGVVVMVMSLRQFAYLYKPVDQGNDSGDVEHARTNLSIHVQNMRLE